MQMSDVFLPFRSILLMFWFLFLCIVSPSLAALLLLGGTGYAVYDSFKEKESKDNANEQSSSENSTKRNS